MYPLFGSWDCLSVTIRVNACFIGCKDDLWCRRREKFASLHHFQGLWLLSDHKMSIHGFWSTSAQKKRVFDYKSMYFSAMWQSHCCPGQWINMRGKSHSHLAAFVNQNLWRPNLLDVASQSVLVQLPIYNIVLPH